MITVISSSVSGLGNILGRVFRSILSAEGNWANIQPLIGIGIAMGVILFAIKTIKSLCWGF